MPSESELRESLKGRGPSEGSIDLEAVLRRARARRRPRVLLAAGVGTLALAGVLVPASVVALGTTSSGVLMVAEDGGAGDEDGTAPEGADATIEAAPANRLNLCEGTLAEVAPAPNGLVLEVAPVTASATDESIPVVITLRNTGDATVRGTTGGSPALTLSRDGLVLWHSNGPTTMIAVELDLDPGESLEYATTLRPVVCSIEDDVDGFRDVLPAAGPGDYRVGAAIDFTDAAGTASLLVTGPTAPVELR